MNSDHQDLPAEEPSIPTESSSTTAKEVVERTLLILLGAAALTKDRLQAVVTEFVRRGELSSEDGKDMVMRLGRQSRDEARGALQHLDASLQGTYRDMGLATRKALEDMEFRMRQLEHRINLIEQTIDASSPTGHQSL